MKARGAGFEPARSTTACFQGTGGILDEHLWYHYSLMNQSPVEDDSTFRFLEQIV